MKRANITSIIHLIPYKSPKSGVLHVTGISNEIDCLRNPKRARISDYFPDFL